MLLLDIGRLVPKPESFQEWAYAWGLLKTGAGEKPIVYALSLGALKVCGGTTQ